MYFIASKPKIMTHKKCYLDKEIEKPDIIGLINTSQATPWPTSLTWIHFELLLERSFPRKDHFVSDHSISLFL